MRLGLVLTNDWEVFGDGSGDYFDLQHRPLQQLLGVVEDHGARLTVMAEVGQQWAHLEAGAGRAWAREIATAWEAMLRETVKRRSDVQLHLHPQWLHATCIDAGRWQVDFAWWATGALPPDVLRETLQRGKQYLERLLRPVDAAYACVAFRAGGYCIQPSRHVIAALRAAGFRCDSSVSKGLVQPPFYDYRDAPSYVLPWFASPEDVGRATPGKDGLLELPIYTRRTLDLPILRKVISPALYYRLFHGVRVAREDRQWLSEKRRTRGRRYPLAQRPFKGGHRSSVSWWLAQAMSLGALQLDYDALPPSVFVRLLEAIYDDEETDGLRHREEVVLPVVASGHTKDMHNTANIARILAAVRARLGERIVFWTLRDAIDAWTGAAPAVPTARARSA